MSTLHYTAVLLEGISHLEDLPLREFIRTVESLKNKIVTEKLDGANLWFGIDENGLFTSREGKSPKKGRFYDVSDYAMVANYNAFRAAHLALEKVEHVVKKYLQNGDMVEVEVLFGRQPNTVTYGVADKSFIVVLRGVNDTPQERVDALSRGLNNKVVKIESTIVSSPDGNAIELTDIPMIWEFTQVRPIDAKKVDTTEAVSLLTGLKKFLALPNTVMSGKSNEEVAELSLTSIPKEQRDSAKKEREVVLAHIMNEFKVPIKELLLNNFVRKIKSFLQAPDLHPSEDIGIEGVVVRDPITGSQTKIVDKDVFTAINTFNSAVRSTVSGLVRTTDQDAATEMRGGVFGQAKIRIADLLGAKELAMSSGVKRFISKFKKTDAQSTAAALADSLNVQSVASVRTKISAILKNSIAEIDSILHSFRQEAGEFKLKLKTGKEIGITPEIMKRTLTAFAETKKDIAEINANILKSRTAAELVNSLYGKTIESLFSGGEEQVKESFELIKSISEDDAGAEVGGQTTAGNISAVPFKMGGKQIIRRQRNFVRPKKFSSPAATKTPVGVPEGKYTLIKAISEDWAHVKDMKFAADVDDSAIAKNDIEFKQLRNTVSLGNDVTQMDVNRYLDKAHEINDQVDTVVFGMETSDGDVVKVYVSAIQAEEFEAALAQLLGKEDDVEQVINILADKFDIVDVEWPASYQQNNDQTAQNAGEADSQEPLPPEEETDDSKSDATVANDEDEIDLSVTPSDDEASVDEPDEPDEAAGEDSANETDEEDLTGEEDEFGQPKKKRKKRATETEQTEESAMLTLGEKFKQKLLSEARPQKKLADDDTEDPVVAAARAKYAKQLGNLLDVFPQKQDKAILTLLITLGAPIKALVLHKAELRKSIDGPADMYMKNSSFRLWVKKLLAAYSDKDQVTEELVETSGFDQRLSSKYQHVIYHILVAAGLPTAIEKTASRALMTGIKARAKMANDDTNIRIYLMAVADQLGVSDTVKNMSEPNKEEIAESILTEDAKAALASVMEFLTILGFDLTANRSLNSQAMRHQVKTHLTKLGANPTILRKLDAITGIIAGQVKTSPSAAPQLASVQHTGNEPVIAEADQGAWIIGAMGSEGMLLKVKGMSIKIDSHEAQKLAVGLDEQRLVSVKDGGKRYIFTPGKKGAFTVKLHGDDVKFPDGIDMPVSTVQEILDMIASA